MGYLRVSTTGQADDGVSLDAQEAKIRAYCQLNDLDLVGIFTDAGISGKSAANRPALQSALQVADQGAVLIVYSLSRLARSTVDTITITERLTAAGSDLVSLSEKIDTTTAAGRMFFRLMAILAEFERELIVERTRAAINHKREKGERLGRIPYGYTVAEDGKTLTPDPEELGILAMIRDYSEQGLSLRGISKALEERGILARNGKPFAASTIKLILGSEPALLAA